MFKAVTNAGAAAHAHRQMWSCLVQVALCIYLLGTVALAVYLSSTHSLSTALAVFSWNMFSW